MKPPKTPICPNCGFKATKPCDIDILDEDLVQLTRTGKPKAQQILQEMSRPGIYGQLCQLARDRGKSESWVKANYKEIFGTWPRQDYHLETPSDELVSWIKHKAIQWHKGKGKQS